ncbi:MAG: SlyX family protein [Thiomicrorhabdus sp.]|nr:SlyX family protein [Thiomicrorhabdus sp.]
MTKQPDTLLQNVQDVMNRVNHIEMNQSFHEQSIEALEKTVALQHQEIKLLEKKLALLSEYLKTLQQNQIKDPKDEVPPPHY